MIRLKLALGLVCGLWSLAAATSDAPLVLSSTDRLLILAPHPDDETLACGGVIQDAVAHHIPVRIVFLTYGDFNKWSFTLYQHSPVFRPQTMRAMGEVRRQEALDATAVLGVSSGALTFLGYPDYETLTLWDYVWNESPAYESRNTNVRAVPYATAFRPDAPYKGDSILQDLVAILKEVRPTKIFFPQPSDRNVDHRALAFYLRIALWNLHDTAQDPTLYAYLVHYPGWPAAAALSGEWITTPLNDTQKATKAAALKKHRTQNTYSHNFLTSFIRPDERFALNTLQGQEVGNDFSAWTVTRDSETLTISGRLAKTHRTRMRGTLAAFGYRHDTPFETMPKPYVTFDVPSHQRDFTVGISLKTLGNPEKILVGGEAPRRRKPFRWNTWTILD
jgi:LmbE family N-acetylglucosaminyl deacetylase